MTRPELQPPGFGQINRAALKGRMIMEWILLIVFIAWLSWEVYDRRRFGRSLDELAQRVAKLEGERYFSQGDSGRGSK